jgi:hypothetical protein
MLYIPLGYCHAAISQSEERIIVVLLLSLFVGTLSPHVLFPFACGEALPACDACIIAPCHRHPHPCTFSTLLCGVYVFPIPNGKALVRL